MVSHVPCQIGQFLFSYRVPFSSIGPELGTLGCTIVINPLKCLLNFLDKGEEAFRITSRTQFSHIFTAAASSLYQSSTTYASLSFNVFLQNKNLFNSLRNLLNSPLYPLNSLLGESSSLLNLLRAG